MSEYLTITDSYINIDFQVQDSSWPDLKDLAIKATKTVFQKLNINKLALQIEFSIILTNNDQIQEINYKYRNKNSPTNTLSFPAQDIILDNIRFYDGFLYLGDIIFAYMVIKDEAIRDNKTFNDHFSHLLVHSLLHLLGYDHIEPSEAEIMENLEIEILSLLKIESPY